MEPSIAAAKAGVTTGEWGETLRGVFGEYRAPTGVNTIDISSEGDDIEQVRMAVTRLAKKLGATPRFLVGKPGLDGHSNGAEQIAVRAGDCNMEVIYEGIRSTPAEIVEAAISEGVHVIGLSILSGSHVPLVRDVMNKMREKGLDHVPVVVGGIIPADDEAILKQLGIAAIYRPKDYEITGIIGDVVALVDKRTDEQAA